MGVACTVLCRIEGIETVCKAFVRGLLVTQQIGDQCTDRQHGRHGVWILGIEVRGKTSQLVRLYLEILEFYLPKMATREEVVDWIKENIDFSLFKNKMQAMGTIMKHFGKLADGKMVNVILREWD